MDCQLEKRGENWHCPVCGYRGRRTGDVPPRRVCGESKPPRGPCFYASDLGPAPGRPCLRSIGCACDAVDFDSVLSSVCSTCVHWATKTVDESDASPHTRERRAATNADQENGGPAK